jgi:hypothetical protein
MMHGSIAYLTQGLSDEHGAAPLHIPPHRIAIALRRAAQLVAAGATALRVALLLPMLYTLLLPQNWHWYAMLPLVAMMVGGIGVRRSWWSNAATHGVDAVAYAFFISLTGGITSPFLWVCVGLVPLAALQDGTRGAVTAACYQLIAVLVTAVFALPTLTAALPSVLVAVFVCGVVTAWVASMGERLLHYVCSGSPLGRPVTAEPRSTGLTVIGDIEQLVRITDPQQLVRAAKQVARSIVGAPVDIQVGALRLAGVGEQATRIVCDAAGTVVVLTVHQPAVALDAAAVAQLRLIGHLVARHGTEPVAVVDARDVTVDTTLLTSTAPMMPLLGTPVESDAPPTAVSTWDTLDIPGLAAVAEDELETAVPTTPLAQAMVTTLLSESTPKRRTRATSDSAQLNLWI